MAPSCLRLILADQLTPTVSALDGLDTDRDTVLMAEVAEEAGYVPHHPKKIAFLFAAMRHFADDLVRRGVTVRYVRLDDPTNTGSLTGELDRTLADLHPDRICMTECGEWRLDQMLRDWAARSPVPVDIRTDTRFLASKADFAAWAEGRRQYRMEHFYRMMRRRYDLLMAPDGTPVGGRWNFDADNRKPVQPGLFRPPAPPEFAPDGITQGVLDLVRDHFSHHYGALEPFRFGVTAEAAERAADAFCRDRLPLFGDHQDAMVTGEPVLYHALISQYLNAGLLDPLDLCRRAERAWRDGRAPLNAAEGFIRQILGWREYVRGLYWLKMPDYAETNALSADRPLPDFFWTGRTEMNCLAQSIGQTLRDAYAHHIQRLMVIGNFALLCGLSPRAVCDWYLAVYMDAYDWVELPNTHGMALYADGGILGSKPYAASGRYIDRMSDYCAVCRFDPKQALGDTACPYNYLYWDFLMRNKAVLGDNPRMGLIYKGLARMDAGRLANLRAQAHEFLEALA